MAYISKNDVKVVMLNKFEVQFKLILQKYFSKKITLEECLNKLNVFKSSWSTSRIDIKNYGTEENSIDFLFHEDDVNVFFPNWFKNKEGKGSQIESTKKHNLLIFNCQNKGILKFTFMGVDFRNYYNKRVPICINFTKIVINDEEVFVGDKLVWHNDSFSVKQNCEDGEIYNLKFEFETIYEYFPELYDLLSNITVETNLNQAYNEVLDYIQKEKISTKLSDSRIKIGVLGACVSRDIFTTRFNEDYKKYFQLMFSYERESLVSLMQNPIYFEEEDIIIEPQDPRNRVKTEYIKNDLDKSFIKNMVNYSPDYFIIDMDFEVKFGVYDCENFIITGNFWDYPETEFFNKLPKKERFCMENFPNAYYEYWKIYCDKFFEYIKKNHPNTKIILNKCLFTDKFKRDDGTYYIESKFTPLVEKYNPLMKKLENYIENTFDVEVLDITDMVILDENHRFGRNPAHYHKEVYNRLFEDLKKICGL